MLVSLKQTDAEVYEARAIRRLESRAQRVVGLFEKGRDGFGRLTPTDKRIKTEFSIHPRDIGTARSGDIIIVEAEPARRLGTPKARVVERIGHLAGKKRSEIRDQRKRFGIQPHLAQIDTMAAEFPAETNYLYSSYHARNTDVS